MGFVWNTLLDICPQRPGPEKAHLSEDGLLRPLWQEGVSLGGGQEPQLLVCGAVGNGQRWHGQLSTLTSTRQPCWQLLGVQGRVGKVGVRGSVLSLALSLAENWKPKHLGHKIRGGGYDLNGHQICEMADWHFQSIFNIYYTPPDMWLVSQTQPPFWCSFHFCLFSVMPKTFIWIKKEIGLTTLVLL